jgi:hypothetical protein
MTEQATMLSGYAAGHDGPVSGHGREAKQTGAGDPPRRTMSRTTMPIYILPIYENREYRGGRSNKTDQVHHS